MSEEVPIDRAAWIDIANRFRRAAIRGGRLQLEPEHVRALLDADFYGWLAEREGQAMREVSGLAGNDELRSSQEAKASAQIRQPTQRTLIDERAAHARAARLSVLEALGPSGRRLKRLGEVEGPTGKE